MRQRRLLGLALALVTALVGCGGTRTAEPPAIFSDPWKPKMLHVYTREGGESQFFLERSEVRSVLDRAFLVGHRIDADYTVWIPLSEIVRIEDFADLDKLKAYWKVTPVSGK